MGARARESKGRAAALLEAGAIEAIVDCMHRHTNEANLQEAVGKCRHHVLYVPCRLANFIHHRALFPTRNLTHNFCATLLYHLYVANQALWALWTLAAQECYLQRVTSSGAIEPILTAMRTLYACAQLAAEHSWQQSTAGSRATQQQAAAGRVPPGCDC